MTSAAQTVTVSNPGLAPLKISSIVSSGAFAQTNDCGAPLPAGATCSIAITFTPAGPGTSTGKIAIADNAPGSPHLISLTGLTGPVVILSSTPSRVFPRRLDFGMVPVGTTSAPQPITLVNATSQPIRIRRILILPRLIFQQTNSCGASIAPGASCTFEVTFTPTSEGKRFGLMLVIDNARPPVQLFRLTGQGTSSSTALLSSRRRTERAGENWSTAARRPGR